jgi:hypothetical protein
MRRFFKRTLPLLALAAGLALTGHTAGAQSSTIAQASSPSTSTLYDWPMCPQALSSNDSDNQGRNAPGQQWDVLLSPYAHHWNDNPEHKRVNLISFDRYMPGKRFCGLALFTNSFGQGSAYAHVGKRWDGLLGQPKVFAKVSAGLIYGYRGAYKDKIPFNNYGIAPAVIPALGYQLNARDSVQVMMLGDAGFLLAWGLTF